MLYEYKCDNCESNFEFEQNIKDKPKKRCPNCKKHKLIRLVSLGGAFILKGSGWYKDGYSSKPKPSKKIKKKK